MNEEKQQFTITEENAGYAMQQFVVNKQIESQNKEKVEQFKNRLNKFEEIESLEEAKELVSKIVPVANEINRFRVGNAKCTVIKKDNLIRISVDTDEEFLSYNFE